MRLPLGVLLSLAALRALAAGTDAVQVQAGAGFNVYQSSDGVQVLSPQTNLKATLDSRSSLSLDYGVDAVSAASFDYARSKTHSDGQHGPGTCKTCHSSVDALSGATRSYNEERQSLTLGADRRIGETQARLSWYHSDEHDYRSDSVHIGLVQALAGRDSTVSLDLEHGADMVLSTINPAFAAPRYTVSATAAWTQLLGPRSQARLLVDYAETEGYLADPYDFVIVGGNTLVPTATSAPDRRQRWDLALTYKQALAERQALEASWRYYQDDWSVNAQTLELSYSLERLGWVLEPEYRFYTQSAASFFRNDYAQAQPLMTRDLALAAFSTHWLGLDLRGPVGDWLDADLRYGHSLRVDDLDYSHYYAGGPVSADTWQFRLSLR